MICSRLMLLSCVALVVACAEQVATPLGAADVAASDRVCSARLDFPDEPSRTSFLSENTGNILQRTSEETLYIRPDNSGRSMIVLTRHPDCGQISFDRDLHLDGADARVSERLEISAEDLIAQLSDWRLQQSELAIRRCVARLSLPRDKFGPLYIALRHTGLRGVQLEWADGVTFAAFDEDCDLASSFLADAVEVVRQLRANDLHVCGTASLQQCGYPYGIEVGEPGGQPGN